MNIKLQALSARTSPILQWEVATKGLEAALEAYGQEFKINEGDGAFYGPKIDFHIKDALGRTWQCGTVQLDMSQPERFNLFYIDKNFQTLFVQQLS